MDEQEAVRRLKKGDPGGLSTWFCAPGQPSDRLPDHGDRGLAGAVQKPSKATGRSALDPKRPFEPWFLRRVNAAVRLAKGKA
jgi:hypothetical protein